MRVVPWITDGSVSFLLAYIERFHRQHGRNPNVLEFGMGSSTLFFAFRSESLVSFEHDANWHDKTVKVSELWGAPPIESHRLDRPYSTFVAHVAGGRCFDVILLDGRDRVACLEQILKHDLLAKNGILVIDNTERAFNSEARYAPMLGMLEADFVVHHYEQTGRDRTGWLAPHRWITTVAWRKRDEQHDVDLASEASHAARIASAVSRRLSKFKRSVRKRLNPTP